MKPATLELGRALVDGCASIPGPDGGPIPVEWPLAVFALESGFRTDILQAGARLVMPAPVDADGYPDQRPVAGPAFLRLSHGTGARGRFQKMPRREERSKPDPKDPQLLAGKRTRGRKLVPDLLHLYAEDTAEGQTRDAFAFWRAMMREMGVKAVRSREALYLLNFMPATLLGGEYGPSTPVVGREGPHAWAWRDNAVLDHDKDGIVTIADLGPKLDDHVAKHRARFDEELTAANAANLKPTV